MEANQYQLGKTKVFIKDPASVCKSNFDTYIIPLIILAVSPGRDERKKV